MSVSELTQELRGRFAGGVFGRIDRVWLTIAAVMALIAILAPEQFMPSLGFTVDALVQTAPFLLLAIALAAYAKASGSDNIIATAFQGSMGRMIVLAALIGGLSPFCSCGVIPLIAALLSMGVPLAPVMAFWLASPVMDPSMFMLTTATLGLPFAIGKTVAAVGLGLLGGFGTLAITRMGGFADVLRPGIGDGGCGARAVREPKPVRWAFWDEGERRRAFRDDAGKNLLFLGKWLTLAFVLESLMLTYVPAEAIAGLVGGNGIVPVAIATVVGVPAYLNGYAALPVVAGLMQQGMSAGAAMAFLIAGGVSSLPAAIAVFALVRQQVFVTYLGFALAGSMIAGLLWMAVAGSFG